ncbi:MAG: pyridoxamine 5'-phosphate oxidase family protein [Chitinophagaceae bacterium]|nr:pyridoxamine 5'-phosphate oxidase family protein [Chitinophagaceae bacterium]
MIGKLTDEQIEEVLYRNIVGHLGCNDERQNYVVPISYVYDGKSIIAHSLEGLKINLMRNNPNVCIEVDDIKNFNNWKSVILWGQYQELTDERDRYYAMKFFVDKLMRLKISETAAPPEMIEERIHPRSPGNLKPVIYRIIITKKTGRFES